jgi:intergrase/recombinase
MINTKNLKQDKMNTLIFNKLILNHHKMIHMSFILVKNIRNNCRYSVEVSFDRKYNITKILYFHVNVLIIEFY